MSIVPESRKKHPRLEQATDSEKLLAMGLFDFLPQGRNEQLAWMRSLNHETPRRRQRVHTPDDSALLLALATAQPRQEPRVEASDQDGQETKKGNKPGVQKDKLGRPSLFVTTDGTVVEYRYKNESSKKPDTIVINDTIAWTPNDDRSAWNKYERQNDQWVFRGQWQGTIELSNAGEPIFKSRGEESNKWTVDGAIETIHEDGSSVKKKGKRILKATRSNGSSIEPIYDGDKVVSYIETIKLADGKEQKVTWEKKNKGEEEAQAEWISKQRGGEVRTGLRLTDAEEWQYTGSDGKQHTARRNGTEVIFDPKTNSTVALNKEGKPASIKFGDGTVMEFTYYWHPRRMFPDSVKVMRPDGTVTNWQLSLNQRFWTRNGQGVYRMGIEVTSDYKCICSLYDKQLRIEYDLTGAQNWFQTDHKSTGGAQLERHFQADSSGRCHTIVDPVIDRTWKHVGNTWKSGSDTVIGELETEMWGYSFLDEKTGRRTFVENTGIRTVEKPTSWNGTAEDLKRLSRWVMNNRTAKGLCEQVDKFDKFARAEGATSERLAALYGDMAERLKASRQNDSLRQDVEHIEKQLKLRTMLFEQTPLCTREHAEAVESVLKDIHPALRQLVMRYGYTVLAGREITEIHPDAAKLRPRGYLSGRMLDSVIGENQRGKRRIIICQWSMQNGKANDDRYIVPGILRHEFGHALDDSMQLYTANNKPFSDSDQFKMAYEKDIAAMSEETKKRLRYYTQLDSDGVSTQIGRQETFAEVATRFILDDKIAPDRTDAFRKDFPEVFKLLELALRDLKAGGAKK
jgi:hypothetical protein